MTYGCHDQPRPTPETTYPAQRGWNYSEDGTTRTPIIVRIKHAMSCECRYDKSATDTGCTGCKFIGGAMP